MNRILAIVLTGILLASSLLGADIKLVWEAPLGTPTPTLETLRYRIYMGKDGGPITNALLTTTNLSATITNMAPGSYQLFVKGVNVWDRESPPSNILTLPDDVEPGIPTKFTATVEVKGMITITVK